MTRVLAIFLSVSLLFGSSQIAAQIKPGDQQKTPNQETLRIETELVQLEVTVTDKQGNLIKNLRREDFELKNDGKVQDISYFSVGTAKRPARWITTTRQQTRPGTAPVPTAPPTVTETEEGRHIILAVDDIHLAFGSLGAVRDALKKFIREQLTPNDQVALMTTSGQMGMYQQFTNDQQALLRAVQRLSLKDFGATSLPNDVPRITAYQAELIDNGLDPDALLVAINEIIRQTGADMETARMQARAKAKSIVSQNTNYSRATLTLLEETIRSLKDLPGRKSLMLVSDGFLLGGPGQPLNSQIRKITDAANRSGVVVYALDARGLVGMSSEFDASQVGFGREEPMGARSRIENDSLEAVRNSLNALSRDTGGFPIFNNNDLSLGLKKILDDTETYYLLAFEPSVSYRDGRFRSIDVTVKGHPEYRVRSNKGFLSPDDKAAARADSRSAPSQKPESVALNSLFPLRGLPVDMAVGFLNSGAGKSFATIVAHLKLNERCFESVSDRHNGDIEVFGAVYDEKGKPIDSFRQTAELRLKQESLSRVLRNGMLFKRRVPLEPGIYQVRLGARSASSKDLGSASAWIEIPDLSQPVVALSSIFLSSEKESAETAKEGDVRKLEEQAGYTMPAQIGRRFKKGEKFDYTIFAYNLKQNASGAREAVVQTQIYADRKLVMASPLIPMTKPEDVKDASFLSYGARMVTADLEPGTYELRSVVVDRTSKTSVHRSITFTID